MVDLNSTSAGRAEGLRGFEDLTLRFCSLRYLQPHLDVAYRDSPLSHEWSLPRGPLRPSGGLILPITAFPGEKSFTAWLPWHSATTVSAGPVAVGVSLALALGIVTQSEAVLVLQGGLQLPPEQQQELGQQSSTAAAGVPAPQGGIRLRRNGPTGGLGSSPGSIEDTEETENNTNNAQDDRKKQPVKRACNECRQQKLRCDVIQEPFTACSRCGRLKLECKIESNFKRIGKRSRNAEMEREIIELRRQIANANAAANAQQKHQQHQHSSSINQGPSSISTPFNSSQHNIYQTSTGLSGSQYMGSHEAVASLLDLRSGLDSSSFLRSSSSQVAMAKRLEGVSLAPERVTDLFSQFFTFYHPFLPFLDRDRSPEEYYSASPLLFWSIISVGSRRYQADPTLLNALSGPVSRLVWSVLADVPQSYHVVKALALLCTWPFPTSSTSTDPTFMLCGMMMHIAMQIGLHRPSHAQDFSKFRIEFREGELKDRVKTWGICNIVAQRVATGYGQPSQTLFDWTLSSPESADQNFKLPAEIKCRLDIEKFCDKVTRGLYSNARDPVGLSCDDERFVVTSILTKDFEELEGQLRQEHNCVTIWAIRSMSVSSNDLPERLAEVLAQMWRTGGNACLSTCFEIVGQSGNGRYPPVEAFLKNPTNPDSNADSSASSVTPLRGTSSTPGVPGADSNLSSAPSSHTINIGGEGNLNTSSSGNGMGFLGGFMEPNYEVFDPLNWMLDGLVDFPYSLNPVQGLES
ncbi:hypothetical protein HCAG_04510 [Histoplasma mississippiense (nom. inval.)]|uniref:hypothetical protein n=1 Tax=Ajellomyces capsulatus (strain NAm1 / WU24) TaxID=2059318 RepID=UPI000157C14E|nr:hypothetical protein HCAG_04510 [Histoplasma mississippiense (nom. inval.)]EDN08000.1 hypothetical protein HCAG_04510 [Histoplasma mississippiense (nom. inval.)]